MFGVASDLRVSSVIQVKDNMPQALFLDRDGTLIDWVHYLSNPDKVVLTEGVAEALKKAKAAGCRLFLHTNQSGVGRGYFTMKEVDAVNARMYELLRVEKSFFDEVCVATDNPSVPFVVDTYRKPSPRFAREMVERYGLDDSLCYYVGDSPCDVETGLAAGMNPIGILYEDTDESKQAAVKATGASVFSSVAEFVAERFGE